MVAERAKAKTKGLQLLNIITNFSLPLVGNNYCVEDIFVPLFKKYDVELKEIPLRPARS